MEKMSFDLYPKKHVEKTSEKETDCAIPSKKVDHMDLFGAFNSEDDKSISDNKSYKKENKNSNNLNLNMGFDFGEIEVEDKTEENMEVITEDSAHSKENSVSIFKDDNQPIIKKASQDLGNEFSSTLAEEKSPAEDLKAAAPDTKNKNNTEEKTSSVKKRSQDISMRTRASSIGNYIDKIKEKMPAPNVGEKLNQAKIDAGDEVSAEDKLYSSLENGCNITLDLLEGAGEHLAFRLKRGATSLFSSFQNKMLKKKFKRTDNIIQYGDFIFYEMNEELMLYRYVGIDTEIKIPSYVEGLPVCYLEKSFLRFNSIKSVGRGLSVDRIQDMSIENIKDNFLNIKSIQLPNTLKILPSKVFSGCSRIDELIIPESVTLIQPNAFVGCRPARIIFLGKAPRQLQETNLAKVKIFCKEEYFDSFFSLMRNYDDYIPNKKIKEKFFSLRKKVLNSEKTSIWNKIQRATDLREETAD